jgi:hypothetical protein
MQSNSLFYFTLGFVMAIMLSMVVVAYAPPPDTQIVCGGCGSPQWHSVLADGEEF